MTKTQNYNLNQWDAADPVRREDFNADNAAIDAALAAQQAEIRTKADQTDLNITNANLAQYESDNDALMAQKANQSELDTTNADLAALASFVGTGGHICRIVTGSYTGTGTCGKDNPTVLTFDFYPVYILLGNDSANASSSGDTVMNRVAPQSAGPRIAWTDNEVSWYAVGYTVSAEDQFNAEGVTYHYLALGWDNTAQATE